MQKDIEGEISGKMHDDSEKGNIFLNQGQKTTLIALIFLGIASSILLYIISANYEWGKIKDSFEYTAKGRIHLLKENLEEGLQSLEWIAGLYYASQEVERSEFTEFVRPYLETRSEIRALEWIPRVSDKERSAYETAAKNDGFTNFQITERDSQGHMVRAARRKEYFPEYFVVPYKGNETALGFDLASNPEHLKALSWSCDNNVLAITEPITLVQETNGQHGVLVFKPIFFKEALTDSVESRRKNLNGFALAALSVDSLVDKILAHSDPFGMDIYLYDVSVPKNRHFICSHKSRTHPNCVKLNKLLTKTEPVSTGFDFTATMDVLNRKWQVICIPAPFLLAKGKTFFPLTVMISGFGLTGLLFALAMIIFERAAERKLAEKDKIELEFKLRQKQKMEAIGTLAGGIAHDFNNILGALIGYTDLAKEDITEGTRTYQNLEGVLVAANRAKELVKQILTFSRSNECNLVPVKIDNVVQEALKMLRATLPTTIEIQQDINCNKSIIADETQIHQILVNLGTNAAHAMAENGGTLQVALSDVNINSDIITSDGVLKPGAYVKLVVKDNGCGMYSAVAERMFEPFYTTKGVGNGMGMGLSVVHGIVESHNGVIAVDSKPGQGTTFEIFFPCAGSGENIETGVSKITFGQGELILFVDDEKSLVDMTTHMLQRIGYKVVGKTSSAEALEIFLEAPAEFDLVITDQTMPKMTGIELAKELMKIRPDVPIILCTGFSDSVSSESAKAVGIRDFIMKPVNKEKMSQVVREVLDRKGVTV